MRHLLLNAPAMVLVTYLSITIGYAPALRAQEHAYLPVSYCELVQKPMDYDGKKVAVRASYRYGFEWQEMFCMRCRAARKTWLEFEAGAAAGVRHALAKAPHDQGTLNATFYGIFRGVRGPYGDGGYDFKFDLTSATAVEVVSRQGWVPERLTHNEQKKLCQGDDGVTPATRKAR
jgi:hypothetical protein